jgi:hypothetical protein
MDTQCKQCGRFTGGKKFCCERCKWTWHNRNRTLTPNVDYKCKVCGKRVLKWVAPSRVRSGQDTLEYCSRTCAGKGRAGANHPQWRGGRRLDKDGYVMIYCPDHPHARKGCVLEHRLVVERKLGRILRPDEVVHHINRKITDNRAANLRLYESNGQHKRDELKGVERDNGRFKRGVKHTGNG